MGIMDEMDWIEKLGGWAVVLLMVRWFMGRMDRLIDTLKVAVERFVEFERESKSTNEAILEGLEAMKQSLVRLCDKIP